ncbi:hypothetical protein TcCL_Unassigned00184 [Trypanosoma cruzi]|nr:hypothetical protein TcCL_Unassigned00184 [Trypanosoma cruzi]
MRPAVFGATDPSKITAPSGSIVKLLGANDAISDNDSPLSAQVEKQPVASNRSDCGYIHPPLPSSRGAPVSSPISPQFFVTPEPPCPAGSDPFATWTAAPWRTAVGSVAPHLISPPKGRAALPADRLFARAA